ncbi:cation diffusion facilitator family metal ion transporter [Penicillium macrosclerotiorum]|uniref:cation diffusion facilitator family metal ion transporter n=1 Tax=Penicillium macrosclerotiorum TaxID=303699 RepID=UPI0025475A5E|nr:cation diffusion facilitator family metal ion transporter [Penicillium macrosclerotiorum]KAJ5675724.1 cation diffusion facilitator family metal ion transporter [Penicillium macrosclerotiorum]
MPFRISRSTRLIVVIVISTCFFLGEISVGFYTHSLALIADAFHYLNDLVGFIVALVALKISEKGDSPSGLSFGWQRAQLLGAFFNGALLLALGISIFLQSIERFISLHRVENPVLVLIVGCIGLGLNIISALFLHEHGHGHDHSPAPSLKTEISPIYDESEDLPTKHHNHKHTHSPAYGHCHDHENGHGHGHDHGDLGMMGVLLHVLCDAANNLGVIASALVVWLAKYDGRYYADPGVSIGIALMIILSSVPLVRRAGLILLESAPNGVDPRDVQHDLESVPGVHSIHELHIWRLNQQKTLASVHVVVSDPSVATFLKTAKIINQCFHAYGIHSTTLQPEILIDTEIPSPIGEKAARCQVVCGSLCEALTCCG